MPGEFYIEGKKEKVDLSQILGNQAQILSRQDNLEDKGDAIKERVDRLAGETPVSGSTTDDWETGEADVVSMGADGARHKVHDLTLSIHNLAGTAITVRLYKKVNGVERKCYEQNFDATADPPGLPIINGTWGIHGVLRVTLQSNNAADNGKAVDYDCMMEAMS